MVIEEQRIGEATPERYEEFFSNPAVIAQLQEEDTIPDLGLVNRIVRNATQGLGPVVGGIVAGLGYGSEESVGIVKKSREMFNEYGPTVLGGAVMAAALDWGMDAVEWNHFVESGLTAFGLAEYGFAVARPIHQLGFRNYLVDKVREVPPLRSRLYDFGRRFGEGKHKDWPLVYASSSEVGRHKKSLKTSWLRTALVGLATAGYIGLGMTEHTADAALRLALIDNDRVVSEKVVEPSESPERVPSRVYSPVEGDSLAAKIADNWVSPSNVSSMKRKMTTRQWEEVGPSCGAWTGMIINEMNTGSKDVERYCKVSYKTLGSMLEDWQPPFAYNIDNPRIPNFVAGVPFGPGMKETHSLILLGVGKDAFEEYRSAFESLGREDIVAAIDIVRDIESDEALVLSYDGSSSINFERVPLDQKPTYDKNKRHQLKWPIVTVKPFLTDDTYANGCSTLERVVEDDGPGVFRRGWDWISGLMESVDVNDTSLRRPLNYDGVRYGEEHSKYGERSLALVDNAAVDLYPLNVPGSGDAWVKASFDGTAKFSQYRGEQGKCIVIVSEDGQDKDFLCNVYPKMTGPVKTGDNVAAIYSGQPLHRELKVDKKTITGGSPEEIYQNQLEAVFDKYGLTE